MGSKSSAPPAPDYTEAARQTAAASQQNATSVTGANRWNEQGPNGSVTWTLRPGADPANAKPGDYVRTTSLSPELEQLRQSSVQGGQQAGDWIKQSWDQLLNGQDSKDQVTDAMYRRGTQFYDRRFNTDEAALETQLINSGLARGSEAWNNAKATFGEDKNKAYADATDRAVLAGEQQSQANQNNAIQRLISAMAGQQGSLQLPTSSNTGSMPMTQGTDFLTATNQQYGNQLADNNASNARSSQTTNAIITAAAIYF